MPPSNPAFRSVDPDTTPEVKNQYTQALIHNGIIYGSGTIPWNRERQIVGTTITEQAVSPLRSSILTQHRNKCCTTSTSC